MSTHIGDLKIETLEDFWINSTEGQAAADQAVKRGTDVSMRLQEARKIDTRTLTEPITR
jgi:hypothetical protein